MYISWVNISVGYILEDTLPVLMKVSTGSPSKNMDLGTLSIETTCQAILSPGCISTSSNEPCVKPFNVAKVFKEIVVFTPDSMHYT